jgi:hypothetical protein
VEQVDAGGTSFCIKDRSEYCSQDQTLKASSNQKFLLVFFCKCSMSPGPPRVRPHVSPHRWHAVYRGQSPARPVRAQRPRPGRSAVDGADGTGGSRFRAGKLRGLIGATIPMRIEWGCWLLALSESVFYETGYGVFAPHNKVVIALAPVVYGLENGPGNKRKGTSTLGAHVSWTR